MKFSEAFFSTEKIIYPFIFSICFGAFLLIIANIFNNEIADIELQIFMGIGFIIGNYIKSNKLIEEELEKERQKKMNKNKVKN